MRAMKQRRETNPNELVAVASVCNPIDAHILKSKLESDGIRCHLDNENMARMNIFYSNMDGGVKVMVRAADAEEAIAIIKRRRILPE